MMELLIIKSGDRYIRVKDNGYLLVSIEKASVFPKEALKKIKKHEAFLNEAGYACVHIKKLVVTEADIEA